MKLLIYEYFAFGVEDQEGLKRAGFVMLDAVIKDFAQIPDLHIITLLDSSFHGSVSWTCSGQEVETRYKKREKDWLLQFQDTVIECDMVLIIAPEMGDILAKLTRIAEHYGKTILGSSSQTLQLVSNKAKTLSLMKRKGLSVPQSEILKTSFPGKIKARIVEGFSFPLVIKPIYGTGGEGVWLIETELQLVNVLQSLPIMKKNLFLVQEYILGQAMSVSCFVLDGQVLPLSLNRQIISLQDELVFQGIIVPFEHPQAKDILNTAVSACESVQGLRGFVGVDIVVNSQGPVLMEINARITLSYVALRKVVSCNLAQDLLHLCLERTLPDKPAMNGAYTLRL